MAKVILDLPLIVVWGYVFQETTTCFEETLYNCSLTSQPVFRGQKFKEGEEEKLSCQTSQGFVSAL